MNSLVDYRRRVDSLASDYRLVTTTAERERVALAGAEQNKAAVIEAQRIVQGIAQALQQRAHNSIAKVVTRCLQAVFDDPYEFKIRFDMKRGKTEARLVLIRDGKEFDDPLNEVGGGVMDVAALALRLACIVLAKPPHRRLVILDEPFAHVRGKENRKRTGQMILKLSEDLGFQIVICSDIPAYRLGTVIEL